MLVKKGTEPNTGKEKYCIFNNVHQGSVLKPLLFIIVLEALSHEFHPGIPWEDLYADDLVIIAESLEEEECVRRFLAGLSGSVGSAVRLETRRSWVQPPSRSATFFRGDRS